MAEEGASYISYLLEKGDLSKRDRSRLESALSELRGEKKPQTPPKIEVSAPAERKLEIVRFTPETRETLEQRGYLVHELTSQSIKTLRDAGRPFWSSWHKDYPQFEALESRSSEVAINPQELFIPDSNRKTYKQQLAMVEEFSEALKVQGAEAILGEMPDYVELAFTHLDATGDRLFGEKYGYNYTRTNTKLGRSVAGVGFFYRDDGLSVDRWRPYGRSGRLFAAPLVVPTGTK